MPSQKQVRWAQLRVGLTVLFASITLAVLVFLMTGTQGLFTKKLTLLAYVDNAGGLRTGAPVRLQGVDVGNVVEIRVVPEHAPTAVEIKMRVSTKSGYNKFIRKDTAVVLSTAGVLGETFVDLDSTQAKGEPVVDGDTLRSREVADIQDVVRSSQSTLQNVDVLLRRADRIMAFVEGGEGSVGKLIYDKALYNNLNNSVNQVQTLLNDINAGKGSIGKLLKDDELYARANNSVDRLSKMMDDIDKGQGTIGKLVKDPTLYNNANQTIGKANELVDQINQGKGALGKFARDEEFARKLDSTMTKLALITDRLEAGEGSAGKLLRDPSVYNNVDQMLVETRGLVKAIRENPKKYLTIRFHIF
ncbi:MAG TPA: MlaD family protein [Clostridia bacterium]|nr:MlaD family protein [Clostridia bacterium]